MGINAMDWHDPGFDDSGFPTGEAPLGFGTPEVYDTVGSDEVTYYFATTFEVPSDAPNQFEG